LARRLEWNDVAEAIGISVRSLLDIRRGRNGPKQLTARALDDWLGWPHGEVERLLAGDEPTIVNGDAPTPAPPGSRGERVQLTMIVNTEEPEPDYPPGGLRNQSERIIWAMSDVPWQVRSAQIQAAREVQAALDAGERPRAKRSE
jgi:hypothetical protein